MNIYDMADAWNNGATDWDAIKIDVADSGSSANSRLLNLRVNGEERFAVGKDGSVYVTPGSVTKPSLCFTGSANRRTGFYEAVNDYSIGVALSGGLRQVLTTAYIAMRSDCGVRWSSAGDPQSSHDVELIRDDAGVLAQRRGTTSQGLRIYNTHTDATNWERAGFTWDAYKLHIGTYASGTGVARDIGIYRGGLQKISLGGNGAITMHGAVYPSANQAYYMGYASLRWLVIYGQHLDCTGNITFANIPTTDPGIAGRIWRVGVDLKVSEG